MLSVDLLQEISNMKKKQIKRRMNMHTCQNVVAMETPSFRCTKTRHTNIFPDKFQANYSDSVGVGLN